MQMEACAPSDAWLLAGIAQARALPGLEEAAAVGQLAARCQ
jgi:hypothetical protein